jgi:transposase
LEEGDSLLPVKYTDELKARAVELVIHAQADPDTANGAITRVANELGLSRETLRVWVRKHKDSGKATPAESVDLEAENRRLRAELAEAKRVNEILKRASAFFAAELDRPSKRGYLPLAGESSPSSMTIVTSSESSQSCAPCPGLRHGLL